jgi:formamidopyrimidine-DNA glycosylase
MPELPEVETIRCELLPHIRGRRILRVTVLDTKTIGERAPAEFAAALEGRSIEDLERRGKYLVFRLSAEGGKRPPYLIAHLKLTGALLYKPPVNARFKRVAFALDDGGEVVFTDLRRFGRMWLADDPADVMCPLGPEPFSPAFTLAYFRKSLARRKAPVKSVLLDQKLVAGVGNMYADEALFASRIHPMVQASALTSSQSKRLFEAVKNVLAAGIRCKGASTRDYVRPDGQPGDAHHEFKVAHRRGEDCLVCGNPLERMVVGQRGTYFCPHCQKGPA